MPARETPSSPPAAAVLILGVGNLLRQDEGFGVHAVRRLAREPLPRNVRLEDGGTDGAALLDLMRGHEKVILIDLVRASANGAMTARVGGVPRSGEVVVFRLPVEAATPAVRAGGSATRSSPPQLSLHGASVAGVVALARALDLPLPPIWVVGLVSDALDWSTELSPEGARALERAVIETRRLLAEPVASPAPEGEGR